MALRFEELIEWHHEEIFSYLWRLMGKDGRRDGSMDAEDLTRNVFLRAYEGFAALRPNSNHRAWLYKIATHCAYTQLRRMKHRRDKVSFLKDSPTEPATAGDDSSSRKDMEQRVRALVNVLPVKQKTCVTLRYLQDLDYPEIAQILSCSQESARANVYQAIRHLRLALEGKKMTTQKSKNDVFVVKHLRSALGSPTETTLSSSMERVEKWFAAEAPLIQWGEMSSPLGPLFAAVNERGLCALDFGRQESEFLERFDNRARLERDPKAIQPVLAQLREYFAGDRSSFNLPVDISRLTPFQRSVLDVACRIVPGQVWTYHRVAEELGRPRSSRPVGGALARNPIPIVIPCHRVVASDGSLGGYSGGSGLKAKRWLLRLEGAL